MDPIVSYGNDLDLDIDLESGEGTSGEEENKIHSLSCENSLNSWSEEKNGFPSSDSARVSTSGRAFLSSDEFSAKKNEEQLEKLREVIVNKDMAVDREKLKKPKTARPPKPPRPPTGPTLGACDMLLLKEISELNSKRRQRERIRNSKKVKKEKPSSLSNLFACLVTIIFFLVIMFHGLMGSRA